MSKKLVQLKNVNNEEIDPVNLNYETRLSKLEGTILYDNSNGNTGNIILSDSASNYKFLMVFWKSTYNLNRLGISLAPNSGYWSLFSYDIDANTYQTIYKNNTLYQINGSSMTVNKANNYNNQNQNIFSITKVVGYK